MARGASGKPASLTKRREPGVPFVQPRLRELEPGSAECQRRDELLAIMRDESRPHSERDQAAIEAMPLCYVPLDPIVTVTHMTHPRRVRKG